MAKTVVLNAGHGGHDGGAMHQGLKEKDLTLDIAKRTQNKLKGYDVNVVMTRTTDKYHSLSEIANIANRNNADLFVSIHINAGGGTGFESFIYNGNVSNDTKKLQDCLHNNIMKQLDVRDRGKKGANFAVVRETEMPAALTENLFIDGDNNLLKKDSVLDKIAQGHADGIVEYLGLKKDEASKTSKPSKKPSKPSKKPSNNLGLVDYMKSKNMDSSYNNRAKLAKQYGIANYKGTAKQNTDLLNKLKAGKPKSNKPAAKLKVDGYMGKLTISALQRYFGTVVDGVISKPSLVIKALQKLLGVKQDGYFGPITIKALQNRFGTVQDGVISKPSLVIKELQRRLNRGKL